MPPIHKHLITEYKMLRLFATFCLVWITNGQDTVTFGSYTYYINHMPLEFSSAERACTNMNATLAVINNEALYRQLVDFIENSQSELYFHKVIMVS